MSRILLCSQGFQISATMPSSAALRTDSGLLVCQTTTLPRATHTTLSGTGCSLNSRDTILPRIRGITLLSIKIFTDEPNSGPSYQGARSGSSKPKSIFYEFTSMLQFCFKQESVYCLLNWEIQKKMKRVSWVHTVDRESPSLHRNLCSHGYAQIQL